MAQKKKKILVVEDDRSLCKALVQKLTLEGFEVVEAHNGDEGLEAALKDRPNLILLDIIMPKMDGITMLRKLRSENENSKSIPVIILTNLGSADDARNKEIADLEPSYYLLKSDWKMADVVAKVRELLEE